MSKEKIELQFRRLEKRINELEKFIENIEGTTNLTEVDYQEIKHLIYLIKCQKDRCKKFTTSQY